MTAPTSFDEALCRLRQIEQDLALPEWTLGGVRVWKLLRHRYFLDYRIAFGLAEPAHPTGAWRHRGAASVLRELLSDTLLRNPFLGASREFERIVIAHPRKTLVRGEFVDPISARACDGAHRARTLVLDQAALGDPRAPDDVRSFWWLIQVARATAPLVRVGLGEADRRRIEALAAAFPAKAALGPDGLRRQIEQTVRQFVSLRRVVRVLLRKVRPRCVYIVVGYGGNEAVIAAARSLRIPVLEFQHGSLGPGHMGYDFPGWDDVPYFPDHFLAFGPGWLEGTHFPRACRIHAIGAPHLTAPLASGSSRPPREPRHLLVLSQGPVARRLLEEVASFLQARSDWSVTIRPHPSERPADLRAVLEERLGVLPEGLRISGEESLLDQASRADVALGVNSTALLEAMVAGCKLALLEIGRGGQAFVKLIDDGHATLVHSGAALAAVIDTLEPGDASDYLSVPPDDLVASVEAELQSQSTQPAAISC